MALVPHCICTVSINSHILYKTHIKDSHMTHKKGLMIIHGTPKQTNASTGCLHNQFEEFHILQTATRLARRPPSLPFWLLFYLAKDSCTLMAKMLLAILILFLMSVDGDGEDLMSSSFNRLRTSEDVYMNWVRRMGSRNHSGFLTEGKNKFRLCKLIKVHKKPELGDFNTVKKAIDSIRPYNPCRVVISVAPGTYWEKIEIPVTKVYVTLEGSGPGRTIIRWDDTAHHIGPDGQPLGTYGSATIAVNAPYFVAKNIIFKNKASPAAAAGAKGKQAVAVRISADMAAFINCKFVGAQDTLYDHQGRHYFKNCHITGSIDFIFGNGLSLYQDCHLHAKARSYGSLTAQKRESMLEETGFSFVNCKVTGSGTLYLGRAWGTFSRVVFAYTFMDKIIIPPGWYDWGDKQRHMTVFYGQFKCSGPGAGFRGRVSWARELTQQEVQPFISLSFIDGHEWLSQEFIS